jgi:hypothetical protein
MELDFSGLWSWTVPLWSLFVLVLFLGGVLLAPAVLEGMPVMTGGSRKHVRWASDVKIAEI